MRQPGEAWLYNTGADVLGVLIARASGQPLEAFMRERIFEPLGMKDTAFSVPAAKLDRFTDGFTTSSTSGAAELSDRAADGQWSRPPAFPSGAAGLVSTVDDYLAFGRMLLEQGRAGSGRILSAATVAALTSDQLTPQQRAGARELLGAQRSWGFGVSVITRHGDPAGSPDAFGWDGGLGTSWLSDPGRNLVAILMTQSAWTSAGVPAVHRDFWKHAAALKDNNLFS
jgi:CubicO group peptidase (beta-lactamase class C family)